MNFIILIISIVSILFNSFLTLNMSKNTYIDLQKENTIIEVNMPKKTEKIKTEFKEEIPLETSLESTNLIDAQSMVVKYEKGNYTKCIKMIAEAPTSLTKCKKN